MQSRVCYLFSVGDRVTSNFEPQLRGKAWGAFIYSAAYGVIFSHLGGCDSVL
jgi:hypothetical protein